MFIVNHPGPWQSYLNRPDNKGLSLMEVKNRYMQEQLLFENYMSFQMQQQMLMSQQSSGGGPSPSTASSLIIVDPNAQAFITAAGITDPTQQAAIDNLVIGLKADGLWTPMQALYPFIGGTATQHKYNLKDPRDLDVAYRLTFNGGWTHNANGAIGNGIDTAANTYYSGFGQGQIGVYNRGGSAIFGGRWNYQETPGEDYPIYGRPHIYSEIGPSSGYSYFTNNDGNTGGNPEPFNGRVNSTGTNLNLGLLSLSGNSSQTILYRNGVINVSSSPIQAPNGLGTSIWLGGTNVFNDSSYAVYSDPVYGNSQLAFGFITTTVLNGTQNTNLYNRIQTFQTALSRQV
jgi:hypothetical protein